MPDEQSEEEDGLIISIMLTLEYPNEINDLDDIRPRE